MDGPDPFFYVGYVSDLGFREDTALERYLKIVEKIDKLSDWSGKIISYLVYPLVGGVAYEVIARYLFNAPTVWAYDLTYMLYGSIFMLGAGLYPSEQRPHPDGHAVQQLVPAKAGKDRRHHVPDPIFPGDDPVFLGLSRLCRPFLGDQRKGREQPLDADRLSF